MQQPTLDSLSDMIRGKLTIHSFLLVVGMIFVVGNPALAGPDATNLAPNPSFEKPGGWSFWAWAPKGVKPTSSPAWDTEVTRTGKRSIRTRCSGGRHTGVWDNEHAGALIPVEGNKVYRCEVWIKSEVAEGKTLTARITVGFRDADERVVEVPAETQTRTFTTHTDWTPVDLRVPVPDGARFARVDLLAMGTGTAWFDDVLVVDVTSCELPRGVLSETLRGTSTAWVNGELISDGTFVLRRGTNVIALQCDRKAGGGGVAGSVRILPNALIPEQEVPLDDCWKGAVSPGREDWHSPDFDDSGWDYATRLPDGSVWAGNSTGAAICLRRVLVVQCSRFQGIDTTDGLHIARGTNQHISLGVASPTSYAMQDLVVEIQNATDLRLEGVDDTEGQFTPPLRLKEATTRSGDGGSLAATEFRFENAPPVDKNGRIPRLGLVFNLAEASTAEELEIRYRCRGVATNRNVTELWNRLPVVCLPPLANKRPNQILLQIFHSWFMPCSKPQMVALVDTWWQAGFNSHGNSTSKYIRGEPGTCPWLQAAKVKGMTIYVEGPHPSFFASILKEYPDARMVNFDGPSNNLHCAVAPVFLVEQGRGLFRNEITQFIKKTGAAGFHWDLEYGPFALCDLSPQSLETFAARAKLDHVPTKDEVRQRYREQWIDFTCWMWAEVGKVMREGIKEADPSAVFCVYSGYQSAYCKARYAIDWRYFHGVADMAAMGYGRQPMIETFQALPETPLKLGVHCSLETPPGTYKSLKNKLLRRITDGGRGVLLYEWSVLDGRAYHKIAQAAAVLADFETFFLRNDKTVLYQTDGDISKEDVVMLTDGDARLLLVFNDDPNHHKKGTIVLQDMPTDFVITDYPARVPLGDAASPLAVNLPPNDVAVFHVAPKR